MATQQEIEGIYNTLLGRASDASGMDYWVNSGMSVDDIANSFRQSSEYQSAWANGAPKMPTATAQATTQPSKQLSAQQAADLIHQSMITGVPTATFNQYGGYDAVYELAKNSGASMGAPTVDAILKYGNTSGSGNQSYMSGGQHKDIGLGYDNDASTSNYYYEAARAAAEDKANLGLTLDQIKWKQQAQQSSSSTPSNSTQDFTTNELKVAAIADKNNPVVRQAMARARQNFAGRGLLNTSMAEQAAQEAAIAKALEIAAPDTAAYYQDLRDGKQFDYQKQLNEQQFGFQSALNQQSYGQQDYMARLSNDLNISNAQAQYDMKVGDTTHTNYLTMIDRIQQDTTKQVQQINSSAMPYTEKEAAIKNIQAQAQAQIANANQLFKSMNGWQDSWAVAADSYGWTTASLPQAA